MKQRWFDHIDLRVNNRQRAQQFYGKILPALGFIRDNSDQEWGTFYAETKGVPTEFFGFTEDKNHRPNESRIAFWAESNDEVDQMAQIVREAGGKNLEGPQIWPEYSPGYYALFFEDPDGNKLEICCRKNSIVLA
jgi:catechol 2,3-dioxygenase-like lactoylglutathione lyase family enzyme